MNAMDYLEGISTRVVTYNITDSPGLVYKPCIEAYTAKYNRDPNMPVFDLLKEDRLITYVEDGTLKINVNEICYRKRYLKSAKHVSAKEKAEGNYTLNTESAEDCIKDTMVPLNEWYRYKYAYFLRNLRSVPFEEMDCRELVKLLDYIKDIVCIKASHRSELDNSFQFLYVYAMKRLQEAPVVYKGYLVYYKSKIRFRKLGDNNENMEYKDDDGLIDNLIKFAYCYANQRKLRGVYRFYPDLQNKLGTIFEFLAGGECGYEELIRDIDIGKRVVFNSSMLNTMKDAAPNFISTGRIR